MSRVRLFLVAMAALFGAQAALAQTPPLPLPKGPRLSVKIDSSPQQAAIYVNDRSYGIQAYTPSTLKLPKGDYKLILDLPGFKVREVPITVARPQAFSITLDRAARPAILNLVAASDQRAVGASIFVDGVSVGTLPNRIEVGAGHHVVEVKQPGWNDYRENVDVAEGENRTSVVALVAQVRPGSILVTADVPGAVVLLDGAQKDTAPTVLLDVPEGAHTVEVRKDPAQPWKQVVTVVAGQQVKVQATLAAALPPPPVAPTVGSVKVLSATPSADVLLDGEPKGPPGIEIKGVSPGNHIVEVRAPGFQNMRKEVQVLAGELRVVAVDLSPTREVTQTAGLHVISAVPDVDVYVDGALVGKAPIQRGDLAPGKHFVVAHKQGYAEFKTEVNLVPGAPTEVYAELRASGSLRVVSAIPGADVYLDGTAVGKSPLTVPDVAVGDHLVEVKLKDHTDSRQTVHIDGGSERVVSADLVAIQRGPSPADVERSYREQSSFGASTLSAGRFNVDVYAGYPYFFGARIIAGVGYFGKDLERHQGFGLGMDLGVELRTNIYYTDVGLRPRFQVYRADPFSLGFDLAFFGGGGTLKRTNFEFEIGPIATLMAGSFVHINFRPYLAVSTDRLCPSVDDIKSDDQQTGTSIGGVVTHGSGNLYKSDGRGACKSYTSRTDMSYPLPDLVDPTVTARIGQPDPRERFTNVRFMLQASIEFAVTKNLNVWFLIEGAPGQDQRMAWNSKFSAAFTDNDFPLYGRVGLTGKF